MEWGSINLLDFIVTGGMGLIIFFLKRSLNQFEISIKENKEEIEKQRTEFVNYKLNSLKELQEVMENQTKTISNLITTNNQHLENKLVEVERDVKVIEKEFNSFKQYVATSYTKQEDFSATTRDVNKKLDEVYGAVKELSGLLK